MKQKERMEQKRINQKIIGKNLSRVMKESGINQIELASAVDISPYVVKDYMNGYTLANVLLLHAMAKKLNCKTDDLLEGVIV